MVVISINLPDGQWEHLRNKKEKQWARVYWNNRWRVEGLYDSEAEAAQPFQNYKTMAIRTIMGLTINKE